jgi:hypothetical protein
MRAGIRIRVVRATFHGARRTGCAITLYMHDNRWFTVEPLPDDRWAITIKAEGGATVAMKKLHAETITTGWDYPTNFGHVF